MNLSIKSSFLGISIKCRSKSYVYLGSMHAATELNKYKFEVLVLKLSISIFCPFYNGSKWCTWYKIVQSLINLFKNHLPNIILKCVIVFLLRFNKSVQHQTNNRQTCKGRQLFSHNNLVGISSWHQLQMLCTRPSVSSQDKLFPSGHISTEVVPLFIDHVIFTAQPSSRLFTWYIFPHFHPSHIRCRSLRLPLTPKNHPSAVFNIPNADLLNFSSTVLSQTSRTFLKGHKGETLRHSHSVCMNVPFNF